LKTTTKIAGSAIVIAAAGTAAEVITSPAKKTTMIFNDGQDAPKKDTLPPASTTATSGKRLTVMQQQKLLDPPPFSVTSTKSLVFDAPFGEGEDRHTGVRAASALVKLGQSFVIAQDDSNFAAVWTKDGIQPLRMFSGEHGDTFSPARGNKKHKPDIELGASFVVDGKDAAVMFGSGSTDQRTRAAWIVEGPSGHTVKTADLKSLYDAAIQRIGIAASSLNLEASAAVGDRVVFFQRGNGEGAVNASFSVSQKILESALLNGTTIKSSDLREVRKHQLGDLDGCGLGFSDAAPLPDGRILFLAAAEASPNTYDDGAVAGSVIGILDHDGAATVLHRVPDGPDGPYKLEGLAIDRVEGNVVHLRAVEDADTPSKPSTALELRLVL